MKTICNVVSDPKGQVAGVFFGSRAEVFTRAVGLARSVYGFEYQGIPDIVVAGASPCEIDFWQSHKALYPAQRMVKPGGTIILCTPAPEGVSPVHAAVLEYAGQTLEADRGGLLQRNDRGRRGRCAGGGLGHGAGEGGRHHLLARDPGGTQGQARAYPRPQHRLGRSTKRSAGTGATPAWRCSPTRRRCCPSGSRDAGQRRGLPQGWAWWRTI